MAATNGASTWKPSQGTNLYCLVNRGTLVWTTCPRSLPDNAAAGNRTHDLPITSPRLYHYTTEPPASCCILSISFLPTSVWRNMVQMLLKLALAIFVNFDLSGVHLPKSVATHGASPCDVWCQVFSPWLKVVPKIITTKLPVPPSANCLNVPPVCIFFIYTGFPLNIA